MSEKITTPEEFAKNMKKLKDVWSDDWERVHMEMDHYILDVLTELGYEEGVDIFCDTPMWYA